MLYSLSEGVREHVPHEASGQRPGLELQDTRSTSSQSQIQTSRARFTNNNNTSSSSRGVEVSGSSPLLKYEHSAFARGRDPLQEAVNPRQYIDDGCSDTQLDVLCDGDKNSSALVEDVSDERSGVKADGRRVSGLYSMAAADFPSTSSSANGWTRHGPAFPLSQASRHSSKAPAVTGNERLFVCTYCGKAFNRPKKVEIHQRVHTGERPFSCSTCGKMFSEAGNLRKHQRVHTREKPYSCGMCGRGFAWIRNLKTHQQKNHPEIYTEEDKGHK